jgi:hypothetical protein
MASYPRHHSSTKVRSMLFRIVSSVGFLALSVALPGGAAAQSVPLGSLMNAIGQAQKAPPSAANAGKARAPAEANKGRPSYIIRQERDRNGREIIEYYDHRGIKRTIRDHGGNG